jgi:colanic acid biosynthesis glycosyl transferase WcaI
MRILLINQFFAPDPAPTGQLLSDVALNLAKEGHEVIVLCSAGSYARASTECDEFQARGVSVQRVRAAAFGHGSLSRIASYASFYAGALRRTMFGPPPDAVLTLTTPPLLPLVGTLTKRFRGSSHFIWEMDVYPDIAVALSLFRKGSVVERLTGMLADYSRRKANAIVAIGPCMRSRLLQRGIAGEKIVTAENWADGQNVTPRPFPEDHPLTVLYSGNLGLAHDIETISGAMKELSDSPRFQFVFAGGGPRRRELESFCKKHEVKNVSFLSYQDHEFLPRHLGNCHVGLVTQHSDTCGSVVPSKTYALMAAGRPFVFIGPAPAAPALNAVRFKCGWQVNPGDIRSLVDLLDVLATNPDMVRAAGRRARAAFEENFELRAGVRRVTQVVCSEQLVLTDI